jgi:hypothetical protein
MAARYTIEKLPLDAPPRDAITIIVEICVAEGWFPNASVARERAEQWERPYLSRLRQELDKATRTSQPTHFSFNSSSEYMIQGACFIEPADSEETKSAKEHRLHYLKHLTWLRDLEPVDFEYACRGIIRLMGATETYVSQLSGDQGIDFYGKLSLKGRLGRFYALGGIDRRLSIWLVGQAKRYKATKVATPELRELVGSIELARTRTFIGKIAGLENLNLLPCDPVFYLFFTTGLISSDGWQLCDASGVIALDGEMVAAFLADNGIGIVDGEFSQEAMADWLREQRP